MKKNFTILALATLLVMPCALRAEEIEIQLMEVIGMGVLPGDDPLDGPGQHPDDPPRPNSFHATIDGHSLSIIKQEPAIPSAQARVVNASTGSIVLNQQFTNSLQEQISNMGMYVLHIETAGGALVGQFVVQ
jgi:hypothetical protein